MTGDGDEAFLRHAQNLAKGDCCWWRQKETDRGSTEPKLPKKWRRKAREGLPEGWISKMAPDEPVDGIAALESGPQAHKHRRMKLSPSEKIGVWRCVGDCLPAGFPLTGKSASCASEYEVTGRRRACRKS